MKKIFLLMILPLLAVVYTRAESESQDRKAELAYEINNPPVPQNCAEDVREHMKDIKRALSKSEINAEVIRNAEVVKISIPCQLLFLANDTTLVTKSKGADNLSNLKSILQYPTMYKVIVAVHADDTGDEQYADNLTMLRAFAVCDFLVKIANTDAGNVNVMPFGMGMNPTGEDNSTIASRAANRRVDIYIVPNDDMIRTAKAGRLKAK